MIRKWVAVCVVFAAFIFPQAVSAEQPKVEIFQIETGRVVRSTLKPQVFKKKPKKVLRPLLVYIKRQVRFLKKAILLKYLLIQP
ncbi:hypothetical protein [Priestia megaterium]|uniref:hypothetical protein n=1 Tax=Priestia megaterium TaxID=1404 RepID=UPI0023799A7F|nr:hypothetical protein [Priestia megaterium]